MSYHNRLSEQSRRAQDRAPDDGFGVLVYGLAIIGAGFVAALVLWALA